MKHSEGIVEQSFMLIELIFMLSDVTHVFTAINVCMQVEGARSSGMASELFARGQDVIVQIVRRAVLHARVCPGDVCRSKDIACVTICR